MLHAAYYYNMNGFYGCTSHANLTPLSVNCVGEGDILLFPRNAGSQLEFAANVLLFR